ncbi:hypothetical protein SLS64_009914 [Diaporthe eres]
MSRYDHDAAFRKSPYEETIFDRMITSNRKRREDGDNVKPLKKEDLSDESAMILNGGTEPPANQMAYAIYYFLRHPEVRRRVLEELDTVSSGADGNLLLRDVEKLPYFTAFVKEGLRMATLIPGRLPRKVPAGGLYVAALDATIPEGSIVGVSHDLIHKDADIFEEPHEFRPERWMGEAGKERMHWLVSFSWGRTDCIGKNRYHLEMVPDANKAMIWEDRVIMHPRGFLHIKAKHRTPAGLKV